MTNYLVWYSYHSHVGCVSWNKTDRTLAARSDDEAQRKVRKMFAKHGFHGMALVAVPEGLKPEDMK